MKHTYTTDQLFNGVYMFKDVEPGKYTLKVSHPEYDAFEQEVDVTANNVTYQNLALDRTRSTAPEVVKYSPVWKDGDADLACNVPVVIDFKRDMDVESVEKNFSITPAVEEQSVGKTRSIVSFSSLNALTKPTLSTPCVSARTLCIQPV